MSWLPHIDELKQRYALRDETQHTYTGWPQPLTHEDLDLLLRQARRAEAQRKATTRQIRAKLGRLISRR